MGAADDFTAVVPLRQGAAGRAVRMLQARMGLSQTGVFTTIMAEALAAYQQRRGLVADGVYGPATNRAMTQRSAQAVDDIANSLSVRPDVLRAVLAVEAVGDGFLDNGLPKLLLERHKVWAMSTPGQREQMAHDVCDPQRGGYLGGSREWGRYTQVAAVIGEPAAAACCSWGLPQIMGSNYELCGAPDVMTFAADMALNENAQLSLWSVFLRKSPSMVQAMRTRDWRTLARLYNGPGNVDVYAAKLGAAYAAEPAKG